MNEFFLIEQYFNQQSFQGNGLIQGIGDDCAIVEVPERYQLAISMDTLVAGVHFPLSTKPFDIGYKALAVNISDCAAAGAKPLWATLAISLPEVNEAWLNEFAQGFFVMANSHQVKLIGGDTTRGPLSVTIQIHGIVAKGKALLRSSARVDDDIYVTGTLGDAGLALQTLLNKSPKLDEKNQAFIEQRLNRPTPRVEIGEALIDVAHACIDISDGLAADLNHILEASKLGAELDLSTLPLSETLKTLEPKLAQNFALYSGDDYELCFTAPASMREKIQDISKKNNTPITRIGKIIAQTGLFQADGKVIEVKGFQHF